MSEAQSTTMDQPEFNAPPKSVFREYLETIVICVLVLLFARGFVFMQSKIPTESMLDTLLVGDYILVDRFAYGAPDDTPHAWLGQRDIERGDVIVFRYPEDPDIDFVKRVVGLPGDTLQMVHGRVLINGQPLEEPYVLPGNIQPHDEFGPVTVPAGEYFMMGDNRDNSRDSRAWKTLPRSLVKGRAFLIWFSYQEEKNDHLNTGMKRIWSIVRKAVNPGKIRRERLFSLIR